VILDTHALIHRAYHALPNFTSSAGEPTGALFGLSTMLLRVIKELSPDYMVAAYDLPEPTFRHKVYKEYKIHRKPIDDALKTQLERSKDLIEAFGIQAMFSSGFEADDVIGTLVEQTKLNLPVGGLTTIIVSGDADIFQLVDGKRVLVYTMRRSMEDTVMYDEKKVVERFGFSPTLLADYKGLRGDPSDNIKGVPGIGEKTATELIVSYGTLEKLYKAIESKNTKLKIKERILGLLNEHKKDAIFSKELATIRRDAPIKIDFEKAHFKLNVEALDKFFKEVGFTRLRQRISGLVENKNENKDDVEQENENILNAEKLQDKFWEDVDVGHEVYMQSNDRVFLMLGKKNIWRFENSFFGIARKDWNDFLQTHTLVSDSIKEIYKTLKNTKIELPKKYFDCGVAGWLLDSTLKSPTTISLAERFLDKYPSSADESISLLPQIHKFLKDGLNKQGLSRVFEEIEMPLVTILADMEMRGIGVDTYTLMKFKKELTQEMNIIEKRIYKYADHEINLNSPSQMGELLFEKLNIGAGKRKKTKTGKFSTKESELEKLKGEHSIIDDILEYRERKKLESTYVEPLMQYAQLDGRVHTTFNQTGTVTGRLSSEAPNMQNIPIRSELGAKLREAFVAANGFSFVSFDYSQIELRILASFAKDKKMIKAFKDGRDIHTATASQLYDVPQDKVTKTMRSAAKAINFGIIYGMGVRQLALNTKMSTDEAVSFYSEYFKDFPAISSYIEHIKESVKKTGYVETLFGRKRFFDLKNITADYMEAEMERMAVNAVIQGTDADITKKATIVVQNNFSDEKIYPLLQVHDELLYEISDDIIKTVVPCIQECMEQVVSLDVPLVVGVKFGKRLGSMTGK
jgi:DNA polymerase I